MEKKVSFTRQELIKWIFFLATVISVFLSLQSRVSTLSDENEQRKKENQELKKEIEKVNEKLSETGKQVSNINGKLDEINVTVKTIAEAIINRGVNSNGNSHRE